ncbi:MAG TPA: SpoIID/LytB domain-containing protein [Bryobacteraceae bacterium]|nr:SpoIID/LytB domain-containing protein [Bryobacteraceae bacterium]
MKLAAVLLMAMPVLAASPVMFKVQVRTPEGTRIVEVPIEKYVAQAVAGESSVFRSEEALKAMAVAARTYAVRLRGRHASEGFDFCSSTHCQRLDAGAVTERIEAAVTQTEGILLWFEGKPAFACYTRDCGGRSEDAAAVWPDQAASYLKSRDDPYCTRDPSIHWQWNGDPSQIAEALRRAQLRAPAAVDQITIVERTASGRARTLLLAGRGGAQKISAGSFRFAMGRELGWSTVRSDRYEIRMGNGRLVFEGTGSGHGVGLCQRGADQMGLAGKSYREILAFYYPGTEPGLTGRGISWQRIGGEGIVLLTARPDRDRGLLLVAERVARSVGQQLPLPRDIEMRVYPDIDTFRNATGEPGSVAACTIGRKIHFQWPVREATIRHELLHVAIGYAARVELPVWFQEGLAEYLGNEKGQAGGLPHLVEHYGLASVLSWLKTGLPAEVRNASANQAPVKSR